MNIRQIIKNTLKEELEEKKYFFLIKNYFDNSFNTLVFINDKEQNSKWKNKDGKEIFIRNWWGMLWILDCDFYNDLRSYVSMFSIDKHEFDKLLTKYVNQRYMEYFNDRPLRDVGDELNCLDLDWQ